MSALDELLKVMQQLRDPENGCPWDREQTFKSLIPYTLEETYEVFDAIDSENPEEIKQELGDLLFQIVFYSQLAKENKLFEFNDIAASIVEKLIRRHPHVFANEKITSAEEQTIAWEKHKLQERQNKISDGLNESLLADLTRNLPALLRAEKIQRRVARVGFDWPEINGVFEKIQEELDEVKNELSRHEVDQNRVEEEIGDLFFSLVNLARFTGVDSETCLRRANNKFEERFMAMEKHFIKNNQDIKNLSTDDLENAWQYIKSLEDE